MIIAAIVLALVLVGAAVWVTLAFMRETRL